MNIDPRLNEIDDCLYRVAARVFVMNEDKVLLAKETDGDWWALPGGGIDHGETIEATLVREIEEELGVPAADITFDPKIVHLTIGNVVNGVPRANMYFKATVPTASIHATDHISEWGWFTKDQFIQQDLHPSYSKNELAAAIFTT